MKLKADQERVKTLICDTLTLLCKNGLKYESEFSVDALIGITLDKDQVFLVNIKETITKDVKRSNERARKRKPTEDKRLTHHSNLPNGNHSESENPHMKLRKTDVLPRFIPDVSAALLKANASLRNDVKKTPTHNNSAFHIKRDPIDLSEGSSESVAQDLSVSDNHNHIVIQPEECSGNRLESLLDFANPSPAANDNNDIVHAEESFGSGPPVWPSSEPPFSFESGLNLSLQSTNDSPIPSQLFRNKRKKGIPMKVENGHTNHRTAATTAAATAAAIMSFTEQQAIATSNGSGIQHMQLPLFMPIPTPLPILQNLLPDPEYNTSIIPVSAAANSNTMSMFTSSYSPSPVKRDEYVCHTCSKTFRSKEGWKIHMERHEGKSRYHCRFCNRGFMAQTHLKAHLSEHTNELPCSCDKCDLKFKYPFTLKKHRTEAHPQ